MGQSKTEPIARTCGLSMQPEICETVKITEGVCESSGIRWDK